MEPIIWRMCKIAAVMIWMVTTPVAYIVSSVPISCPHDGYDAIRGTIETGPLRIDPIGPDPVVPETLLSAPGSEKNWPMFRNDKERTGVTASSGPPDESILWTNVTSGNIYGSPAVDDQRVFIGTSDGKIFAFNATTGELLWTNQSTSSGDYGFSSSPAVYDGKVYLYSNGDDNVYCYNATTGKREWKTALDTAPAGGSSPLVIDDKVYIGSPAGKLFVLDANTGFDLWNFTIGASNTDGYGIESSPMFYNGSVYFGGGDDIFRAVNITTHTQDWSYQLSNRGYTSPTAINGVVYSADGIYNIDTCSNCKIYAFDVDGFDDGNDGWTGESDTSATAGDVLWTFGGMGAVIGSPAVYFRCPSHPTLVFIGAKGDNKFYAIDGLNGSLYWSATTGGDIVGSPSVSMRSEIVYIASKDRKLYAFDVDGFKDGNDGWNGEADTGLMDGDIIWNRTLDDEVWGSPAIADGILYIGDLSNKLWAIGSLMGDVVAPQVLSTFPCPNEENVSLDVTLSMHFSESIAPWTVLPSNLLLRDGGLNQVSGEVRYSDGELNISFDPDFDLLPHETYTMTISTEITDMARNGILSEYVWSFSTLNKPPSFIDGFVQPLTGDLSTTFDFSVLYTDQDNDGPVGGVTIHFDGDLNGSVMNVSTSALDPDLRDGDFTNGELYEFSTSLSTGGNHSFCFMASDGYDVNQSVDFHGPIVVTPNQPPVVDLIDVIHPVEDTDLLLDLTPYIHDPDNTTEELSLRTNSKFATVGHLNLTFNYPDGVLEEKIKILVSDGINSAYQTIHVIVTPVDDPPILDDIQDREVTAWVPVDIDLRSRIHDVDTALANMTVSTNSSFTKCIDLVLILNYTNEIEGEVVNVSVSDGNSTVYDEFKVRVLVGNMPPVIKDLPDLTVIEGEPTDLDLGPYVSDDGKPSGKLIVTSSSIYSTISGMKVRFLYPDGIAREKVTIIASDGALSDRQDIQVTVTPVNTAPSLSNGSVTKKTGAKALSYEFRVVYLDPDGPNPEVKVVIDGIEDDMVIITGDHRKGAMYSFETELSPGTHMYYFKCDDMSGSANATAQTIERDVKVSKGQGEGADSPLTAMMLPLALVLIIVGIIVALSMRRGRGRPGPAGRDDEGSRDDDDSDDIENGPPQKDGTVDEEEDAP